MTTARNYLDVKQGGSMSNIHLSPEREYISDLIKSPSIFQPNCLNLVAAGCGAGKSYFVAQHLSSLFPDVEPCDILFVTSRAITVDQQVREYRDNVVKFDPNDLSMIKHWTQSLPSTPDICPQRIRLMTFDKLINLIKYSNKAGHIILEGVRIVVIDECHALISDTFIKDIMSIIVWMSLTMQLSDKLFIGLTATPEILKRSEDRHGFSINLVLDKPLTMYKAHHLWLVRQKDFVDMLRDGTLPGKTIVMGNSRSGMSTMIEQVPNSTLLVSQHSRQYNAGMDVVRNAIVEHGVLPENNDVLFATTTMREGVTLRPESGVRNVVTFLPDEMHVSQFLGRCRFDVENLVVVYDKGTLNHAEDVPYIRDARQDFVRFASHIDNDWFHSISHLLYCGLRDVKRYKWNRGKEDFYDYMDAKWAVDDINMVPPDKYIYKDEQRKEIVEYGKQCGVFGELGKTECFLSVSRFLSRNPRMNMIRKRVTLDGKRPWCDVVVRVEE